MAKCERKMIKNESKKKTLANQFPFQGTYHLCFLAQSIQYEKVSSSAHSSGLSQAEVSRDLRSTELNLEAAATL